MSALKEQKFEHEQHALQPSDRLEVLADLFWNRTITKINVTLLQSEYSQIIATMKLEPLLAKGLSSQISLTDLKKNYQGVVASINNNAYLKQIVCSAHWQQTETVNTTLANAPERELAEMCAFSVMHERLIELADKDFEHASLLVERINATRAGEPLAIYGPLFNFIKIETVERIYRYLFSQMKKGRKIWRFTGYLTVVVNICEAILQECNLKNFANAKTGLILLLTQIWPDRHQQTQWTPGDQVIKVFLKDSQRWLDLYVTWNMCFMATYKRWPILAIKLLLPNLPRGNRSPENFIYMRGLSILFSGTYYGKTGVYLGKSYVDWTDKERIKIWAEMNLDIAMKFFSDRKIIK
jgi:hypothetical protein